MARDNTFLAAATAATAAGDGIFRVKSGDRNEVRLSADNLAGAEVVEIQVLQGPEDTGTFINTDQQLTVAAPAVVVIGPGVYRAAKDVTVGACAVFKDQ